MESQQYLQRLDDRQLICDLPLVHQHMHSLATSCACNDCKGISTSSPNADREHWTCEKAGFLWSISNCVADILAISLFESREMLLVSNASDSMAHEFDILIKQIITSGQPAFCHHRDIIAKALQIVGHKASDPEKWVISSYKGQAVYPRVFETGNICQPGFLALHWAPGLLFFNGEVYNTGLGREVMRLGTIPPTTEIPRIVTGPLNLCSSMRMEWRVVRGDGYLDIYLTCGRSNWLAPYILYNLTDSLIISCPHDRALPLREPDPISCYVDLDFLAEHSLGASDTEGKVNIVAVDGDSDLRMFAICISPADSKSRTPSIIRDNACLQCCLNLCREAGYRYVIC